MTKTTALLPLLIDTWNSIFFILDLPIVSSFFDWRLRIVLHAWNNLPWIRSYSDGHLDRTLHTTLFWRYHVAHRYGNPAVIEEKLILSTMLGQQTRIALWEIRWDLDFSLASSVRLVPPKNGSCMGPFAFTQNNRSCNFTGPANVFSCVRRKRISTRGSVRS